MHQPKAVADGNVDDATGRISRVVIRVKISYDKMEKRSLGNQAHVESRAMRTVVIFVPCFLPDFFACILNIEPAGGV